MYFLLHYETLLALNVIMGSTLWIGISSVGRNNDDFADLEQYLQPNDIGRNETYDFLADDDRRCTRNCTMYPDNRICYYKFVIEQYYTMGAVCGNCAGGVKEDCYKEQCLPGNGLKKTVLVINRMFMGPAIQVCSGDQIVVDVDNRMPGRSTTIHWHGIRQQETPWMDGVPYVTQCPIPDGSIFRYNFKADSNGTMFYHSHNAFQRFDGISGALIVRTSDSEQPHRDLYDFDLYSHVIHLADWFDVLIDNIYPDGTSNRTARPYIVDSYVINGKGVRIEENYTNATNTPVEEYTVNASMRYRFRIVAVTSVDCPLVLNIQNHTMTLIAVDGNPVVPKSISSLYIRTGDRYDVIVTANQVPGYYPILVRGAGDNCGKTKQYGWLRYQGQNSSHILLDDFKTLFTTIPSPALNEDVDKCAKDPESICMRDVCSLNNIFEKILQPEPTKRFFLSLEDHVFGMEEVYQPGTYSKHYVINRKDKNETLSYEIVAETISKISNKMPPSPLYTVEPSPDLICTGNYSTYNQCLHLIKVDIGDVVDVVLTTKNELHTVHLHGNYFWVIKQGSENEMSEAGADFYKNTLVNNGSNDTCNGRPINRDVVTISKDGFAVIRFEANNVGVWVLHCHVTFHNYNGMAAVFQVGEREQFKPAPRNWPVCRNYLPPVRRNEYARELLQNN